MPGQTDLNGAGLVFVTGSDRKREEVERLLNRALERADIDLPEVQHVGLDHVAAAKALAAWEALGRQRAVIVEDTGLSFEAWSGLPGALVKWFVQTVGVEGLCRMLADFPDRRATATTVVAVYDGTLRTFRGSIPGSIAESPRGENGFGWDSIFIPGGSERTFAEMEPSEKDRFSMRRIAFAAMVTALDETAHAAPPPAET